jgi:hypothetical protein
MIELDLHFFAYSRRSSALVVYRLVELALATLARRDRLPEAVLLEVLGGAVGLVGLLVVVDLEEKNTRGSSGSRVAW